MFAATESKGNMAIVRARVTMRKSRLNAAILLDAALIIWSKSGQP